VRMGENRPGSVGRYDRTFFSFLVYYIIFLFVFKWPLTSLVKQEMCKHVEVYPVIISGVLLLVVVHDCDVAEHTLAASQAAVTSLSTSTSSSSSYVSALTTVSFTSTSDACANERIHKCGAEALALISFFALAFAVYPRLSVGMSMDNGAGKLPEVRTNCFLVFRLHTHMGNSRDVESFTQKSLSTPIQVSHCLYSSLKVTLDNTAK